MWYAAFWVISTTLTRNSSWASASYEMAVGRRSYIALASFLSLYFKFVNDFTKISENVRVQNAPFQVSQDLSVEASWNVMAHAQKTDFVFRRNGRVHLNRRGRQFSRLQAAEVWTLALTVGSNAGYTMFRGSEKGIGYSLHSPVSPSLPLPCVTVCHHISTRVYLSNSCTEVMMLFCFLYGKFSLYHSNSITIEGDV
jgi:hypothetical protein